MSKVIDFPSAKQHDPDQNTSDGTPLSKVDEGLIFCNLIHFPMSDKQRAADWTALRKVDDGSRFHLHGLTYQEEEERCCRHNETLRTTNYCANVTIMPEKAPVSSPAPLPPPEEI